MKYLLIPLILGALFIPLFCESIAPSPLYKNLPPSLDFLFGTDDLGRSLFIRVWEALRLSLLIATLVSAGDLLIGFFLGALGAFAPKRLSSLFLPLIDILQSIPNLLWSFIAILVFGQNLTTLVVALIASSWFNMARLIFLQLRFYKKAPFVITAKALGASPFYLIYHHILPHLIAPLKTHFALMIPAALFAESTLSFLGLGAPPPAASLGSLISESLTALDLYPFRFFIPATFMVLTLMAIQDLFKGKKLSTSPKKIPFPLELPPGQIAIIGPSGCGKSSSLRSIEGGAHIFQEPISALTQTRRIGAQLIETLEANGEKKEKAKELLATLELSPSIFNAYPFELSVGMCQRVGICLALAQKKELIIADEPTSSLDAPLAKKAMRLLSQRERLVFTSHDPEIVQNFAQKIYRLENGALFPVDDFAKEALFIPKLAKACPKVLLKVRDLSIEYVKGEKLFAPLSFDLHEGETLAILGPSGSGKSSLARALFDLERAEGDFKWELSPQDKQMIFQDGLRSLNPKKTIREILLEPSHLLKKGKDPIAEMSKLDLSYDLLDRTPEKLSGGERQRVAILRLCTLPLKVLVCDEITSSLDRKAAQKVIDWLLELQKERGLAILWISHDPRTFALAHQTFSLSEPSREVKKNKNPVDNLIDFVNCFKINAND